MTLRRHLTYANLAATSAVVLAVGLSTSYAVGLVSPGPDAVRTTGADAASVRAYGTFGADGRLRAVRSHGAAVTKLARRDGAYCVQPTPGSGIDPARTSIVVSAIRADRPTVTAMSTPQPASCPGGWLVTTQEELASGLFRAEDVGVTFVIP